MFDTKTYEDKMNSALVHFEDDLKKVRTGRAHPDMLDGILVEVYGTRVPLNQAANITVPEPQLLQVNPFDPSNIAAISKAMTRRVVSTRAMTVVSSVFRSQRLPENDAVKW